jgi:RES domain-containing protein
MTDPDAICAVLATVPVRRLKATLVRRVALDPLIEGGGPDFLFTSGRANRYNPAGVACVYFSEDERTARAEYDRRAARRSKGHQPLGTFFADVDLGKVLDLVDDSARKAVGLSAKDLGAHWHRARRPTKSQLLGMAVSCQTSIAAIRFPSDAARATGFTGFNVVIFRHCLRRPDYVRILGATKRPLQKWP